LTMTRAWCISALYALVAQLVEHRIRNARVVCSIHIGGFLSAFRRTLLKKNIARGKTFAFELETHKNLGQHFLNHPPTIEKIAAICDHFAPVSQALEIGPGSGALTLELLKRGLKVSAIEKDPRAANLLKGLQKLHPEMLEVVQEDILKYQPVKDMPGQLCLGNIPYYITSDIVLWFIEHMECFTGAILMVQDEVATRLASPSGSKEYGRISVRVQLQCSVEKALFVPAKMFSPPPKVDSAVIILRKKPNPFVSLDEIKKFERFTAVLFSARRKMLRRVLADRLNSTNSGAFWMAAESLGVAPETRPDALSPDQILGLFRAVETSLNVDSKSENEPTH
jgi:16S rRNA (adenine1518-N6/adenine1519-N6)-dimethyltransferase